MRIGIFKKVAAAGLAIMMLIALAPGMGQASGVYFPITYYPNAPGSQSPITEYGMLGYLYPVMANPYSNPGFDFIGWRSTPNGTGTIFTPGMQITISSALTLYAQWMPQGQQNITVTYMPNGGNGQATVVDSVSRGSSYTVRTNPYTRAGYTFVSWNTQANGNGTTVNPGQTFTLQANQVLYAQWRVAQAEQVTITYMPNGGNGQANVVDTINKGSSYTVRTNPYTRSGYTFVNWNTQANGLGTAVNPGQSFTLNANQVLYAQWRVDQVEQVTITYLPNGGNGQANVTDTVNRGSSYTVRSNPFTRAGYVFNGWNTQANGAGIAMSPGQAVTADNNYTLYAQWTIDDIIVEIPTGVDGRILYPWQSGDDCNWIEIARNGKYSLIMRAGRITSVCFSDTKNGYYSSYVRGVCNAFFNNALIYTPGTYHYNQYNQKPLWISLFSVLPANARLRNYTVESNAYYKLGTSSNFASLYDGYSKPTRFNARSGNDICFALSFTEAANFISRARFLRGTNPSIQPSPEIAINNYLKIQWDWPFPYTMQEIWLRSPGDVYGTNAAIAYGKTLNHGTVFQKYAVTEAADIHPALWVDSAVFD